LIIGHVLVNYKYIYRLLQETLYFKKKEMNRQTYEEDEEDKDE